nr:hypothetical protein KPHV_22610 [Kitasatospora purpeofusca]
MQYDDKNIAVICPWNPLFINEARALRGRWNASERVWTFPISETLQIRALLEEIFYTDGAPAPGVDILVDLDRFHPDAAPVPAIEIAGRRAVSVHPDWGSCQYDAQASLACGVMFLEADGLRWTRGAFLEVRSLPEDYLGHLSAQEQSAVWVLARHGLDLDLLRRQESAVSARLNGLRAAIQREESASPGVAPAPPAPPAGSPVWRIRCRPTAEGGEQLIVHLDGCLSTQSTRVLSTEEVLDLAARNARLCPTCGAYRTARTFGAPTPPGPKGRRPIRDVIG